MGGAPIWFRGSRQSRVSDNPHRAGLIGSSGSTVRRGTTGRWWCRCLAATRKGRCPSRWSATCRSHGGCGTGSAADGHALVGTASMGHLQAARGCSRSTSLSLPVRGVVLPTRTGAGLYNVRLRHVAVISRYPPDFRATDRQPTSNAIRSFPGLDSTDATKVPGHRPRMRCEAILSRPALAVGYAAKGADPCGSGAPVSRRNWQGKRIHEGRAGRK
jgi:hypothetical protein